MGVRSYKLIVKNSTRVLDKRTYKSISEAMYDMLIILKQFNSLDCYDSGVFEATRNPINKEYLVKRYRITLLAPYTEITIMKISKGSIKDYIFLENLKRLKEIYF